MKIISIILLIITGALNLYTAFLHNKLYMQGLVKKSGKTSFKKLNDALKGTTDIHDIKKIKECKFYHTLSVVTFWLFLLFAILSITN